MAQMHKSAATLRIRGDDLDPGEVSTLLNCTPTTAQRKGEVILGISGIQRVAQTGMWHLKSKEQQPENLDGQIEEILGRLTTDLAIWHGLSQRFRIDLFCGLFMDEANEGLSVSPMSLLSLEQRGIELGLDVYGPE